MSPGPLTRSMIDFGAFPPLQSKQRIVLLPLRLEPFDPYKASRIVLPRHIIQAVGVRFLDLCYFCCMSKSAPQASADNAFPVVQSKPTWPRSRGLSRSAVFLTIDVARSGVMRPSNQLAPS